MICSRCGKEVEDGSKFCLECGNPIVYESNPDTQNNAEAETEPAPSASYVPDEAERTKLEEAELEARKKEQEAEKALQEAQARAEAAREAARQAALAKTKRDASEAIMAANSKIADAAAAGEQYNAAFDAAGSAYEAAKAAQTEAEALGITGLPLLSVPNDVRSAGGAAFYQNVQAPYETVQSDAGQPTVSSAEQGENGEKASNNAKLVTPWGYFLLSLLYCIPVIGWIFLLVHSFGKKYPNRRNFALSIWVRLGICLIIACILVIVFMIIKDTDFGVTLRTYCENVYNNAVEGFRNAFLTEEEVMAFLRF